MAVKLPQQARMPRQCVANSVTTRESNRNRRGPHDSLDYCMGSGATTGHSGEGGLTWED